MNDEIIGLCKELDAKSASVLLSLNDNPHGLHQKYIITRVDGKPIDPKAVYFVLRLDGDHIHNKASRSAALEWIDAIGDDSTLKLVANDLKQMVERLTPNTEHRISLYSESPDDWVILTNPEHIARKSDLCRPRKADKWISCDGFAGEKIGPHLRRFEFQCRRRDLPMFNLNQSALFSDEFAKRVDEVHSAPVNKTDLPKPIKSSVINFTPWEKLGLLDKVPSDPGEGWRFLSRNDEGAEAPQEDDEFWRIDLQTWIPVMRSRIIVPQVPPDSKYGPYRRRVL